VENRKQRRGGFSKTKKYHTKNLGVAGGGPGLGVKTGEIGRKEGGGGGFHTGGATGAGFGGGKTNNPTQGQT